MIEILDWQKVIGLPHDILHQAGEHLEFADLLSEKACKGYDFKEIRTYISKFITRYKDAKYLYNSFDNYDTKITPCYILNESMQQKKNTDPFTNIIDKRTDDLIWIKQFYDYFIKFSIKLTDEEAKYFVESFFYNQAEDKIEQKIGISHYALKKIKKSCLVKVWHGLKVFEKDA